MVGDVRLALERDGDDVLGLIVVEGPKHEMVQGFGFFGGSVMRGRCVDWQCASSSHEPPRDAVAEASGVERIVVG